MKEYFVARYYFDSLFKQEAEKNLISDIQFEPVIQKLRYSYAVGHVKGDEIGDLEVIRGEIGRIPIEHEGFVYSRDEKDFIASTRAEFADTILEFLIVPSRHLILFESNTIFQPDTVIRQFKNIYLQSNKSYVNALTIDFIFDEHDVYEEIKKWTRFTRVAFKDLRPSNPDSSDTFAFIEDLIKEMGGDKTNLESRLDDLGSPAERENRSINLDSRLVREALSLSSHGYGRGEIEGIDETGQEKAVKTYKFRRTVEIDFREDGSIDKLKQVVENVDPDEE